jgi:hypothetical protein
MNDKGYKLTIQPTLLTVYVQFLSFSDTFLILQPQCWYGPRFRYKLQDNIFLRAVQ